MRVVWDDSKNAANLENHEISFEQASVLFTSGDDYYEVFDEAHSEQEDRFIGVRPVVRPPSSVDPA